MLPRTIVGAVFLGAALITSCGDAGSSTESTVAEDTTMAEEIAEAEGRADDAESRAQDAVAREEAALERALDAEERADDAEEQVARLRARVDDLVAEVEELTVRLEEADAGRYVIPSGVIDDGGHVGYLVSVDDGSFSFDMAEILPDGSWKNVNPKIRTLPLDPDADQLAGAPSGTPIEMLVEGQVVQWVRPLEGEPVAAVSSVVLAADGLGVVSFGDPAAEAIDVLASYLGEPEERTVGAGPIARLYTWPGGPHGWSLTVTTSTEAAGIPDGIERIAGWHYYGGLDLAAATGITVGSTAADLLATHPETEFGQHQECCDGSWSPDLVHITGGALGLRGGVAGEGDPRDAAQRALIDLGYPLDPAVPPGTGMAFTEALARFQADRGLSVQNPGWLDTATWRALGLELPRDPAAPVDFLMAGMQEVA